LNVVDLKDKRALDILLTGGKGSELASLIKNDFPVPSGFVITTKAFESFIGENNFDEELEKLFNFDIEHPANAIDTLSENLQKKILSAKVPKEILDQLDKTIADDKESALWAVRSSGVAEDLEGASFAGQYDTFLGVSGIEEISKAVLKCWASFFNSHSIQYRRQRKIDDFLGAVVIQCLINADAAGVCFSIDPVTNDLDIIVINSNFGLGESVVSGIVTPDTFYVDKTKLKITSKNIADKEVIVVPVKGGSEEQDIEGKQKTDQSLSDDLILEVARLAIKVEKNEKKPVDIEWAVYEEKVYLLQSRPITTVEGNKSSPPKDWVSELNTPVDPRYPLYSNGNISEVLPGCITPLSWSYIGPTIEHAFRSQGASFGSMKLGEPQYQVLGFFYHRPYICVSFMEHAAALTPGMSPDTIREEFVGPPDEKTPPMTARDLVPDRWPAIYRVLSTFISKTLSIAKDAKEVEENILKQKEESSPEKLENWTDKELIEAVRFTKKMGRLSDVHIWASSFAVVYFSALRELTKKWFGDDDSGLAAQMVTGIGTLPSANPAFGIYELAQNVMADNKLLKTFEGTADNQLLYDQLKEKSEHSKFLIELDKFLLEQGHRAVCEAEVRNPCWREDPSQVLGMIRNYLQPDLPSPKEIGERQEQIAKEAAAKIDKLFFVKRAVISYVLNTARKNIAYRELLKDLIVLRSDRARRIYSEIIKRMIKRNLLNDPDNIYFLVWAEVKDLLLGSISPDQALEVISRRKTEYEWSEQINLPKIIDGVARPEDINEITNEALKGLGVSPGIVKGRARVILDPRKDPHIEPGEILIAPVTDAGWTPLFINASGLVVDVGGLLSHGSVVAREYGLPAVVGVSGATSRIKTGDMIIIDGSSGTVGIID